MKKIMIALAAVALAACANAAVVKWGMSSGVVTFNGTKLGGLEASLYIVGVNGSADALVDTLTTGNSKLNMGKLALNTGSGQASYDYNSTIAGGALVNTDNTDAGRQYYMVINYTDSTSGQAYTYTSSAVASSGLSDKGLGTVSFTFNDAVVAAGAKDGWASAAVPEPTSGLLMLVGLAGLALRRRRA